jgi:hypothetical protein
MEGMTMLPGIDDLKKKTEVTYEPDATTMLNFAQASNMNFLSIWAIQRDNGGCPAPSTATPAPGSPRTPGTSVTYSSRSPADPGRVTVAEPGVAWPFQRAEKRTWRDP